MYLNKELLDAAEKCDLSKIKNLLEKGADVNAKDTMGQTSLHYAALNGCLDVVELLLEKGADVNAKTLSDITPLHYAAYKGQVDIVRVLLEKGADVNAKTSYGFTPLHYASYNNHENVVRILLENGADPDVKDIFNNTPDVIANQKGYKDIVSTISKKREYIKQIDPKIISGILDKARLIKSFVNDIYNKDFIEIDTLLVKLEEIKGPLEGLRKYFENNETFKKVMNEVEGEIAKLEERKGREEIVGRDFIERLAKEANLWRANIENLFYHID